jgi:hypothetical protein
VYRKERQRSRHLRGYQRRSVTTVAGLPQNYKTWPKYGAPISLLCHLYSKSISFSYRAIVDLLTRFLPCRLSMNIHGGTSEMPLSRTVFYPIPPICAGMKGPEAQPENATSFGGNHWSKQ